MERFSLAAGRSKNWFVVKKGFQDSMVWMAANKDAVGRILISADKTCIELRASLQAILSNVQTPSNCSV